MRRMIGSFESMASTGNVTAATKAPVRRNLIVIACQNASRKPTGRGDVVCLCGDDGSTCFTQCYGLTPDCALGMPRPPRRQCVKCHHDEY